MSSAYQNITKTISLRIIILVCQIIVVNYYLSHELNKRNNEVIGFVAKHNIDSDKELYVVVP